MGQSWQFLSLTSGCCLEIFMKLGESLTFDDHSSLVEFLYRPLFPEHPVEIAQKMRMDEATSYNKPVTSRHYDVAHTRKYPTNYSARVILAKPRSKPALLQLPNELIGMIFSHITILQDMVCLGLTNTRVWTCGESAIKNLYLYVNSYRQAHRLICLGCYAKDLPQGCMSEESLMEIAKNVGLPDFFTADNLGEYLRSNGVDEGSIFYCLEYASDFIPTSQPKSAIVDRLRLAQFVFIIQEDFVGQRSDRPTRWHTNSVPHNQVFSWDRDYSAISRFKIAALNLWVCLPQERSLVPFFHYETRPSRKSFVPIGGMILRNLSKKEYVRSESLGVDDNAWGFAKVLLCRTLWSDSSSTAMVWSEEYDLEWHHGVWAGDAFDIVSEAELIHAAHQQTMGSGRGPSRSLDSRSKGTYDIGPESVPELDIDVGVSLDLLGSNDATTDGQDNDGDEIEQCLQGWKDVSSEARAQLIAIWRSEDDEDGERLGLIDLE
ncbi:hypothetical protein DL93DRAFT_1174539 [Clavulina sp. PMI_390]|nr:hypothetical protein DL93DRAFT_1174539 [Clavulina sp. PMI_390]